MKWFGFWLTVVGAVAVAAVVTKSRSDEIAFVKHTIDLGANEACAWADINGDGHLDLVSGENWFEAPKWTKHKFRSLHFQDNYIDDFSDLPLDVDGDGKPDIVSVSWFSKKMSWWRNPGQGKEASGEWKETIVESASPIEFAFLVDLDNDGKAQEILPQFGDGRQPLAWYEARDGAIVRHVISDKSYGHGIGAGDVNGDGRADILTPKGWFEAPVDPRTGTWTYHPDWDFGNEALGFLHVLDINGDGVPDILSSHAHNYGVFWLEQTPDHKFKKHIIDEAFSQAHALSLVNWLPDGRKAFITGKRFMAHNGHDPGEREPLAIFWYEWLGNQWARHVIEYGGRTGTGMQIAVADFDKDGDVDFAVAGKSGLFLFENRTIQRPPR